MAWKREALPGLPSADSGLHGVDFCLFMGARCGSLAGVDSGSGLSGLPSVDSVLPGLDSGLFMAARCGVWAARSGFMVVQPVQDVRCVLCVQPLLYVHCEVVCAVCRVCTFHCVQLVQSISCECTASVVCTV